MWSVLGKLLEPLISAVKSALGPFGKAFDIIAHFWKNLQLTWTKALALTRLVRDEIEAWKTFKEAVPFRTGVISIPAAIEKTQDLIREVLLAWHAIVNLANQIRSKFEEMGASDPAADAREAIADIEKSGFRDILSKFPQLLKGAERLLVWLGVIVEWVGLFQELTDDFTEIVRAEKAIREEVETGSTVFLSQANRRKVVTLEDGTKMKIRLGNLHAE